MKLPLAPVAFALLTSAAHADLVITEVMAASGHPARVSPTPDAEGDWWELTNTGASAVNLSGYQWDDLPTPATPSVSKFPSGVIIQPGESIIILEEPSANVSTWRAAWGLNSTTQVIDRTRFTATGGEGFSGLATTGDEINLYDPAGRTVAHVEFGASTPGKSLAFHPDGSAVYGLVSAVGKQGAYASTQTPADIGSPGDAKLHFTSSPVVFGASSYRYAISAVKPGGSSPSFTASGLPGFLSLTSISAGNAVLENNRPLTLADAGDYVVQISATSGSTTVQEFVLTILNPSPAVILNEYNAVAPGNFLNGGTASTDEDGGTLSADAHFGRVAWNGGQWVEFAVLGNGGSGPLDMRGWTVEIGTNEGTGFFPSNVLVLSGDPRWQAVPSRTILTFIDRTTAQGGLNSGFALRDRSGTVGDTWSNVWMGDPALITYTSQTVNGYRNSGGVVSGILIDNNNTQFRVKNSTGQVVYGPAGEGIAPKSGVSSKKIFELEGHPSIYVAANVASTGSTRGYGDGASDSTFGFPNTWLEGTKLVTQDFSGVPKPEIAVEQEAGVSLASGNSLSFGKAYTGASASLTFTVRNDGSGELSGLGATVTGTNAADFTISAAPASSLAPTQFTVITVRFAPTTPGAKSAVLQVTSNDADEPSFELNLTATGVLAMPEIGVQQPVGKELKDGSAKISFGTVTVRKSGASVVFTIRNTGKGKLSGLSIKTDGTHAKEFSVGKPAATSVAPGKSTTFKVSFKPTGKGTRSAAIHIKSNDSDESPFDIKLTGTGK